MSRLNQRVMRLEDQLPTAPWFIIFGDTQDEARAKFEAEHGHPLPEGAQIIWPRFGRYDEEEAR